MKLELLTNATVVDDAISSCLSPKEKLDSSSNSIGDVENQGNMVTMKVESKIS